MRTLLERARELLTRGGGTEVERKILIAEINRVLNPAGEDARTPHTAREIEEARRVVERAIEAQPKGRPGNGLEEFMLALERTLDRKALAATLWADEHPGEEPPKSWKRARALLDVSRLGFPAAIRLGLAESEGQGVGQSPKYSATALGHAACVLLRYVGGQLLDEDLVLTWRALVEKSREADAPGRRDPAESARRLRENMSRVTGRR